MFILSTIGGGAVSTGYQLLSHELVKMREQKEAARKELREEQAAQRIKERELLAVKRSAARNFLIDFQDAAEKRNYYAYRVISHVQDCQEGKGSPYLIKCLEQDRIKYGAACESWNLKRHFFERFLEVYLSADLRKRFYDKGNEACIVSQFIALHSDVLKAISQFESGFKAYSQDDIKAAKAKREKLSWDLAAIYDELLKMSMDSESTPGSK